MKTMAHRAALMSG